MNNENGKIDYRIVLDTSDMEKQREQVTGMFQGMGSTAQAEGSRIDEAFTSAAANIGKAFAGLMAVSTFTALSKKIMAVRGEFQQLEVAFDTMLGSAEKANALMNQLVHTAAVTPFGLQDVAGGAKQLLAYGIAADEVNDTLVRLGDIAAGLSIPLNDLVYLYGTTMTQGRVYTQDMRQFMGRGIPLAEELAKQFGVTKDKVSELVTEGKVGFPQVKKAIEAMTSAGGKFGGLMEKQSHTITGQISNIEDAIDMMFNDLGKQTEGIINTGLGAVTFLVEHYKEFGTVLLSIVAAYGEYKAALMAIAAYNSVIASQEAAIATEREAALAQAIAQAQAEGADTAATNANTAAKQANKSAIDMEVASIMKEMEMKVAQAAVDHDLARQELITAQQRVAIAEQNFAARQQEYNAAVRSGNMSAVAAARANLETAAKEKQAAATQLNAVQTNIETTAKTKEAAASKLAAFQMAVDTANKKANTTATGLMTVATNLATRAVQALNAAWKDNPFGLVLSAITLVIGAISLFKSHTDESTDSMQKFRDAVSADGSKLETYMGTLNALHKDTKTYKDTMSNLRNLASDYGVTLKEENGVLVDQEKAYNDLSSAIRQQAAAKVLAESASEANKKAMDAEKEAMDRLIERAKEAHNVAIKDDDGNVVGSYQAQLNSIAEITDGSWAVISQHVMSQAQAISAAFGKSQEDGEKALEEVKEGIEVMLESFGASEEDIKSFSSSLNAYLYAVGTGFQDAYGEMERTEAQLRGLAGATADFAKETEAMRGTASDTYEELVSKQEQINNKITDINNNPMNPQVDASNVEYLKGLLQDIQGLMGNALTSGSLADLRKRAQEIKSQRDAQRGVNDAEADKLDKQLVQLEKRIKELDSKNHQTKTTTSKKHTSRTGGAKSDPKQLAYDAHEIKDNLQKQLDEFIEDLKDAYGVGVTSAMKEGTEKQIQQIEDDTKSKLKALDESIEQLRDKQAEADKQIWLKENPKKKEYEYKTPAQLSIEEFLKKYPTLLSEYTKRKKQIEDAGKEAKTKITEEETKRESETMNAYLEEYGTYYQKRQAIIDQYYQKIKDAKTSGEVRSLREQMHTALGDLDFKVIEKAFGDLFSGDLSQIPTEQLKDFSDQLKAMREQAENLSPEQIQQITDVLEKMQTQMDLTSPIESIKKARQEYRAAKAEYDKYQKAVKAAQLAGDFEAEGKALAAAKKAQDRMNNAQQKAKFAVDGLTAVVDEFAHTLDTAGDAIGGTTGELVKLAASGLGAGVAMAKGVQMFKEAADTASKSVAILAIIQAAFQAVMAVIDMFGGKEDKTLTAYVEAMDNYISMLTDTISDLNDEMHDIKNSMADTIAKYKELVKLQEQSAEAIKAQSQVWLNSGGSARSHTEGVKITKAITDGLKSSSQAVREYYQNGVNELAVYYKKVFGRELTGDIRGSLGRLDWLWKLSDSDIKELSKNTELLSMLGDELSSAIINYAKSLQDMEDTLNEQYAALLSVSYDDFYSDFVDMISDMDSDSSDFAKRFGEYMRKALIQNLVANQYKDRIKKLYEQAGKAAENGNLEHELGALRAEWTQIAKEAREEVKLINDITGGLDSSEADSSSGAWSALGEETGRSLDGRMAAMQIQVTQIAQIMLLENDTMTRMDLRDLQKHSMMTEMSNLIFISTGYLERIARNSDSLPNINSELKQIRQNTDKL